MKREIGPGPFAITDRRGETGVDVENVMSLTSERQSGDASGRRQRSTVIYRSSTVVVGDIRCPLFHRGPGPEEYADSHTVLLVRTGLFTKSTPRGAMVADPNHAVFFTRDEPYRIAHPTAGGDTSTFLSLETSTLLEAVRNYEPAGADRDDSPFPFSSTLCSPRAFLLHHTLLMALRRGGIAPLAVDDLVLELIDELLRGAYEIVRRRVRQEPRDPSRHRDIVEAAKLVIDTALQKPPTLTDLARRLGCSPFHLSRIFHRESGLPIRRYLDRCRLRAAVDRLADGERSLTDLALDLGYADHSHFTNAFRREFGVPPSAFRRHTTGSLLREVRKNLQA